MRIRPLLLSMSAILVALTAITADAQSGGKYASVNGIRMYYEIHRTGHPLVIIHSGGSTITTTFGTIMPLLAKGHKVIAVELQAHGRTSDRNAPESFEQDADDVAGLLPHLKVTGADVLGFSNGGNTAMRLATRHPERVRHDSYIGEAMSAGVRSAEPKLFVAMVAEFLAKPAGTAPE